MAIDTADIGNPHKEILECINEYTTEIATKLGVGESGGGLPYKLFEAHISHASSAGSSTYTVLNDDIGVTAGHNWMYGDKFLFPYSDYKKIVVRPVTKDGTIVHMTPSYQSNQININLYDSSFLNTTGDYYVEIRSYE